MENQFAKWTLRLTGDGKIVVLFIWEDVIQMMLGTTGDGTDDCLRYGDAYATDDTSIGEVASEVVAHLGGGEHQASGWYEVIRGLARSA